MAKKLVAYEAHDGDEGWCVVYATSNTSARRHAAGELDTETDGIEFCRRAPVLDQYAPGPAPILALIREKGWHYECCGCERRISCDPYDEDREVGDERAVETGGQIFCCETCKADHEADRAAVRAAEASAIATMVHYLTDRVPDARVEKTHAFAHSSPAGIAVEQVIIDFSLPCLKHHGSVRYDADYRKGKRTRPFPKILVAQEDVIAWDQHALRHWLDSGRDRWEAEGGSILE